MNKGDILGHEFCGIVDEVGPSVKKVSKGKRYVASFQIACGDCYFCKQKLSSMCEKTGSNQTAKSMYGGQTAGLFGFSHFVGGFAGGQAEYVRVPLADVNLLEIPDDVPDEKALYLSDTLCTAYNCTHDTAVYPNDTVAVFGAGPIGHFAGIFAAQAGASKVHFVDTEPRLTYIREHWPAKYAEKLGSLIDYKTLSSGLTNKETVVSRLKELCGGRGPDCALECAAGEYAKGWAHWLEIAVGAETDTSEIINEMVEGVRNYGRCGVTGVYVGYVSTSSPFPFPWHVVPYLEDLGDICSTTYLTFLSSLIPIPLYSMRLLTHGLYQTNHFNVGSLMQRGIRLIGNGQAPVHKYWEDLLKQIQTGEIDPLGMVSHRVRMEDLDKVYYKFEAREDGMQKVFVETKFSLPACQGCPPLTKY